MDALSWGRFQFGFTVTYHYLFPQLTMGLALLIVLFKALALRSGEERYHEAARFWGRIFGINFAMGVVTGIPLEFQFGTNWGRFSNFAGGVIGLTLALEGMFAFFAESAFLGLFLFEEKRLGPRGHMGAALMLFLGSWLSGYFIIVTNAFMQHPVGYTVGRGGALQLADLWAYLFNPWALWQYAHTMSAAVITSSFVVAAVGAYWTLMGRNAEHARLFLRMGVIVGLLFTLLQLFPTGDMHGKMVAKHQPVALAAMEGKFESSDRAEIAIIGQPVRLSYHGGAGNDPDRRHGKRGAPALARPPGDRSPDALDPDARLSLPLHRHHGRLDDGGTGTSTVAGLRPTADDGPTPTSAAATSRSAPWGSWASTWRWGSSISTSSGVRSPADRSRRRTRATRMSRPAPPDRKERLWRASGFC